MEQEVNALGANLGITDLASLRSKARLASQGITKVQAKTLIDELKALVG